MNTNTKDRLNDIQEANLTYLMLAQQMLRDDRAAAMYRLGIRGETADIMEKLTPAQVSRLAASSTLLCRFRCDDRAIFEMLSGYGKPKMMSASHAAILIAGQPALGMA